MTGEIIDLSTRYFPTMCRSASLRMDCAETVRNFLFGERTAELRLLSTV